MDRRIVMAGLVAASALPAVAQQSTPASPIPVAPRPAETQPMSPAGTPGAGSREERMRRTQQGGSPVDTSTQWRQGQASDGSAGPQQQAPGQARMEPQRSQADSLHIQHTMAIGTVTLQAANFAVERSQHPRVKLFAESERDEQNTTVEILRSLADPAATSSTNQQAIQATTQNAPQSPGQAAATAPVIAPQGADLMERLARAQPGPHFDRDFVQLQLDRHKELLQVHERYLAANPPLGVQRAVAMMARSQIRAHIAELEAIRKELGP
jgi:predicted outer membrane protein